MENMESFIIRMKKIRNWYLRAFSKNKKGVKKNEFQNESRH